MKAEHLVSGILGQLNTPRHSSKDVQRDLNLTDLSKPTNSDLWQQQQRHHHQHHSHQRQEQQQQQQQHQLHHHHQHKHHQSLGHRRRDSLCLSDRESLCSISSSRSKRIKSRNGSMKPLKGGGINKKSRTMDYTNYAYNEAVGRLKLMLASDSYSPSKTATSSYLRGINDDSGDNYSDNMSAIDRPVYADISKYLSPSQKNRIGVTPTTNTTAAASGYRTKKALGGFSSSKENLASAGIYHSTTMPSTAALSNPTSTIDYYGSATTKPLAAAPPPTDSVQAPVEIFNFIEKQEDYIEQLEKESKYCRNELSNLLGKVKDVINENEQLTDIARSELGHLGNKCHNDKLTTSPSSDSDDLYGKSKAMTPRGKKDVKSPRFAAAPNIVYEAKISELEADLMQAHIDLKRTKTENEELKRKLSRSDPLALVSVSNSASNCEVHRKQIDLLQKDKSALEETIRHLQKALDEAKSQQYSQSSKRYINDLVQMERSQAEMEVRHLRDELDRQHERVREMQMEMTRRLADERSNAERRYNNQVDQLGGDLSSQWEQVAKLQLDLERQKRYEGDLKRDLANRNSQIEELKMELRANRSTFLADMAQVNAEKQSLEQEITALRLQLDRATRENKTEAARLNAEINSLRQRLDRADADLLHSKREVLRLNDEIANLEKELAYGEMKNEIRPTKKDLDKRISELQEKHEMSPSLTIPITQRTATPPQLSERSNEDAAQTEVLPSTTTVEGRESPALVRMNNCPAAKEKKEEEEEEKKVKGPMGSTTPRQTLEKKESENVYTSRFDDENIWQNISRSIERLDLDWAKMPPLPKFTPSTNVPAPIMHKNKCHCPHNIRCASPNNRRGGDCEACKYRAHANPSLTSSSSNPQHARDFRRYGNPITATAYSKIYRNTSPHCSKTLLPQPLKPPYDHTTPQYQQQQHTFRHDLNTLDMHQPTYNCSHSEDKNLDNNSQNNHRHHNHHHHHHTSPHTTHRLETTTTVNANAATEDSCRNGLKHTPRRKCHNHHHHQAHQHRSHSSHSHERGEFPARANNFASSEDLSSCTNKTEPLTWLQQRLVLKQTIKACHKCQTNDHPTVTIETDHNHSRRPYAGDNGDHLHLTTCCRTTQHLIRACCDNKECLKDLMPAEKSEQATNTEITSETYRKEDKTKKPFKVDVNVRLVPKTHRSGKEEVASEKAVEVEIQPEPSQTEPSSTEAPPLSTPLTDDNELYLDLDNTSDTEATKL
uniref:Uncharacterized protein n=1 Tax=Stomoxys calcitrans TaxID=35570 RepID=A0A1I8PNQ7_STOCA|nr:unnamed protein product [Stomoxys calcitrans]XP_013102360.1 unnamed protein product [Stomoxys calcitrans]XP_013102369.1 unnamed protein product [Stomoxys calcitrans]